MRYDLKYVLQNNSRLRTKASSYEKTVNMFTLRGVVGK